MATNEEFLMPLRQFKQRRLYANLRRDSVVPLGTAAFLPKGQVKVLKENIAINQDSCIQQQQGLSHDKTLANKM